MNDDKDMAERIKRFRGKAPKLDVAALAQVRDAASDAFGLESAAGEKPGEPESESLTELAAPLIAAPARVQTAQKSSATLLAEKSSEGDQARRINVTVRMDEALHRQLRFHALEHNVTLSDLISAGARAILAKK